MNNKCPVCNSDISLYDKSCSTCRFSKLHKKFLTKKGPEKWQNKVVIPYRKKYEESVYKQIMEKKEYVNFGRWYYNDDNKMLPIEWQVLSVENDKAFLVSRYCIDSIPYNNMFVETTWETCTLRKWLNGVFLQSAFSRDEQKIIVIKHLNNSNCKVGFQNGGNSTYDQVFLLSVEEAINNFLNDEWRKVDVTPYAARKGVAGENNYWWLRNSSINYLLYKINKRLEMDYRSAEIVCGDGSISDMGIPVPGAGGIGGVRPALWVDLKIK